MFVGDDSASGTGSISTEESLAAEVECASTKRRCRDPQDSSSSQQVGKVEEAASLPQPAQEELSKLGVTPSPAGTGTASMDSDDDFMSDASSGGDFLDMHGSDEESLGEGECIFYLSVRE